MSYDLQVRSDPARSKSAPYETVAQAIRRLPGVTQNRATSFTLDDKPKRWMEIDLDLVDEEGTSTDFGGRTPSELNCINFHIPYAFLNDNLVEAHLPLVTSVAEALGWTVFDPQKE